MLVKYCGFDNAVHSRIYAYRVIDPPREPRNLTVQVRSVEVDVNRLKFQDGPGISSARLERELKRETPESRAEADLRINDEDVREYRAQHYPAHKLAKTQGATLTIPPRLAPMGKPFRDSANPGMFHAPHFVRGEIITLLLHEAGAPLDALKVALEGQSERIYCLKSCQEALPLLSGANPPHLVFTQPSLPDGIWADVVKMATRAQKPVNVIVVGHPTNVGLYLQTITGGAFDFIVPPLSGYELTHVMRCAIGNVLGRREAQVKPV